MYNNGYGYGYGVEGDYTHVMGIASETGGYGTGIINTAQDTGTPDYGTGITNTAQDTGITYIFNDTGTPGSGSTTHEFSTTHLLLGLLSIALVVNAGLGLFVYSKRNKTKQANKHSTINPMLRNGTVWTECDASNL